MSVLVLLDWWISTAMTLSPGTSRPLGMTSAGSQAKSLPVVAHVLKETVPVGRL
jgi:hypothetical protein